LLREQTGRPRKKGERSKKRKTLHQWSAK
jgi:hypothetical protein